MKGAALHPKSLPEQHSLQLERLIQGLISCSCNAAFSPTANRAALCLKLRVVMTGLGGLSPKLVVLKDVCSLKGQKPSATLGLISVHCKRHLPQMNQRRANGEDGPSMNERRGETSSMAAGSRGSPSGPWGGTRCKRHPWHNKGVCFLHMG